MPIGIGRSLAAPPSHTTVHTGPYTAIRLVRACTDKTGSALPGFPECDVIDLSATEGHGCQAYTVDSLCLSIQMSQPRLSPGERVKATL